MSRSVLLQLARDSITEVYEAQRTIQKESLLKEHPLLSQNIAATVNIYLEKELRGSSTQESLALVDAIIIGSKKAAFEDSGFTPLKTSEYLSCEIELILQTQEGTISETDPAILS